MCVKPQKASFVKQELDDAYSGGGVSFSERIDSDDVLRDLENHNYIEYDKITNQWKTTQEAIDYIKKYYG